MTDPSAFNLRHYLDGLARQLVPDNVPLPYIILASDKPPQDLICKQAGGFAGTGLDLSFRAWLEERGQWRGRAPAYYLDDSKVVELSDAPPTNWAAQIQRASEIELAIATAIHELGHVLDLPIDLTEPTPKSEAVSVAVTRAEAAVEYHPPRAPANQHSPSWMRLAVHLWQRAAWAGHVVNVDRIYTAWNGTPSMSSAAMALEDEVQALRHVPLLEIEKAAPPPTEYRELWSFASRKWRAKQPADDPVADWMVRGYEVYFRAVCADKMKGAEDDCKNFQDLVGCG